jgi:SNF2 family DNA or RNA helicase
MSLLDFQVDHVNILIESLKTNNVAIDISNTGCGKTYCSIFMCKKLNLLPLVICPKSVISNWLTVIKLFDIDYIGISNYESFKNGKMYKDDLEKKIECKYIKKDLTFDIDDVDAAKILVIFDEAHRCKNKDTQNAKILLNIDIKKIKVLLLSATLADKIENMCVFAKLLQFCEHVNFFNLLVSSESLTLKKIHKKIFPAYGHGLRIADIKTFPENLIIPGKFTMSNYKEIQESYNMINLIVKDKEAKLEKANSILEKILRARQRIEALKIPTICELAEDHLESGNSVVIFVNFKHTLELIKIKLKIKLFICGDQSLTERAEAIRSFQANEERIIICNMQSGNVGISLHDTDGKFPRVSIISPSWSAQDLMQALGRIFRAGGKSKVIQKIVYCANTIEEDVANLIQIKLDNYAQLNDCVDKSDIKI